MTWLDLIIALPLLFGAYRGFTKGIIIEIASVLALILGFYGALLLANKTAELINHSLDYNSSHLHLIAFVVTFIAIVVGVFFMAKVMWFFNIKPKQKTAVTNDLKNICSMVGMRF